jgi:hypothetical protein
LALLLGLSVRTPDIIAAAWPVGAHTRYNISKLTALALHQKARIVWVMLDQRRTLSPPARGMSRRRCQSLTIHPKALQGTAARWRSVEIGTPTGIRRRADIIVFGTEPRNPAASAAFRAAKRSNI